MNLITTNGSIAVTNTDDIRKLVPSKKGMHVVGFFATGAAGIKLANDVYQMSEEDMPLVDWAEALKLTSVQDGVYVVSIVTSHGPRWCTVQKDNKSLLVGGLEHLTIKNEVEALSA